jgi:predicted ATP-grasp superfamily ATP-dependent carboligase
MTEARRGHVLVAGVTTRALAISAARAGYKVTALDAFGDLDLRAAAEVILLRPEPKTRFTPLEAAGAAEDVTAGFAVYTSNFENYPDAVSRLAQGRRLLGNPADVLVRVRDPIELMRALRRQGFATPRTRATAGTGSGRGSWLLKPRRSGGGHGITVWRRGRPVPRSRYLQERIDGIPGSIVFAADGRNAVALSLTRQLVADPNFGAQGFRYCGSLLGSPSSLFPDGERLLGIAAALASTVTSEFGLVGLNGLDFMARDGVPYPIEVNPRFSASMELLERIHDLSMFELHARACRQTLPAAAPVSKGVEGKAIVFARRDVTLGDTRAWMGDHSFADVPHPGEHIQRGHPICTVFAHASDGQSCHHLLTRRAATVYRAAESARRGAA